MESKKKWGWSKKNKFRYLRKMYLNSYSALYEMYDNDFVWDELRVIVFDGDSGYRSSSPSVYKTIVNRRFRFKCKKELRNILIVDNKIDNDAFPIPIKNIKWGYY